MTKRKSTKVQEEFEDTKGVIRIRISKKYRQHNDQKVKDKTTNNDLQNIKQKHTFVPPRVTIVDWKWTRTHLSFFQSQLLKC